MIEKSIISVTNKQRDKCMSWVLILSPKKKRKKERKKRQHGKWGLGSRIHVNHLPVMENKSVIICTANIKDEVPLLWKCFNPRPIEFSWLARTISDDLNNIGGSSYKHIVSRSTCCRKGPNDTQQSTQPLLSSVSIRIQTYIKLTRWKTNILCTKLICIFFETILLISSSVTLRKCLAAILKKITKVIIT